MSVNYNLLYARLDLIQGTGGTLWLYFISMCIHVDNGRAGREYMLSFPMAVLIRFCWKQSLLESACRALYQVKNNFPDFDELASYIKIAYSRVYFYTGRLLVRYKVRLIKSICSASRQHVKAINIQCVCDGLAWHWRIASIGFNKKLSYR